MPRFRPSGLNSGVPYPTIEGSGPTHTWEELEPIAATSVDEVLGAVATDPLVAARMALGLGAAPGMPEALVRRMFELAVVKGDRPDRAHDFKLHEALAGHAALARADARRLIVALCVSGARPPTAAPWDRLEEARGLIAAL